MAPRMKKFTGRQQQYVTELLSENANLKQDLRKVQYDLGCEESAREKEREELVNKSVQAQANLDSKLHAGIELHTTLLHAVEDYLEAEHGKQLADRTYAGAMGRLGDLHSEQSCAIQNPNVMAFAPDPQSTMGWRRTR